MDLKVFIIFFCSYIISVHSEIVKYELKQVVILSRHSIRTPLSNIIQEVTPRIWPRWKEKPGHLTVKGALVESFMGSFFAAWLRKEGILQEICPPKEVLYVYANSKQRTRASAHAFVNGGFHDCNITVHFNKKSDPVFDPVIHNKTQEFVNNTIKYMDDKLKSLQLNSSFELMESILDYNNSHYCKVYNKCDLVTDKNEVESVIVGKKPRVSGPLKVSHTAIDGFLMEYYEGLQESEVAWGYLTTNNNWNLIMDIHFKYHDVIFNTSMVAKDISEPLIKYISDIFCNDYEVPKVTLLMGHDANLLTILSSMRFVPYSLNNQFEKTPIGGKIVFQKWHDKISNKYFLKINYVYQSAAQLRNGLPLSLDNPPQFELLMLEDCVIDKEGFYPWENFLRILKNLSKWFDLK